MSPFSTDANGSVVFPFGMLRRERLDAVGHRTQLNVDRLLRTRGAVVVEDGDALSATGTKSGEPFVGASRDELRRWRRVVPEAERIGGTEGRERFGRDERRC